MTFRGYIKDGRVVVSGRIDLPDGTEVKLQPMRQNGHPARDKPARSPAAKGRKTRTATATTLYQRLKRVIGKAKGLPRDFAAQHDHYIHGAPKR